MQMLVPDPDLAIGPDGYPGWNSPGTRRRGFHDLPGTWRYMQSFRAGQVLALRTVSDLRIALRDDVARLTALPWIGPGYAAASVQDVLDMNVATATPRITPMPPRLSTARGIDRDAPAARGG